MSFNDYDRSPEDPDKMVIYQHLNKALLQEPTTAEKFEVPKNKGDEGLPPPELKPYQNN